MGVGITSLATTTQKKKGSMKIILTNVKLQMIDSSSQCIEAIMVNHVFRIYGVKHNLIFTVKQSTNQVAYDCLIGCTFLPSKLVGHGIR